MTSFITHVTYLVNDYDEAKRWFTDMLDFVVVDDQVLSESKRWVLVRPPGPAATSLLLARAASPSQIEMVGKQSGGRVFLFLQTDDFDEAYRRMKAKGVVFRENPRHEAYGTVVVFEDLYGNTWDLLGPKRP